MAGKKPKPYLPQLTPKAQCKYKPFDHTKLELYTFASGKQAPLSVAIKHRWNGIIHINKGDAGIITITTNEYSTMNGFFLDQFGYDDLLKCVEDISVNLLSLCPSHVEPSYNYIRNNKISDKFITDLHFVKSKFFQFILSLNNGTRHI